MHIAPNPVKREFDAVQSSEMGNTRPKKKIKFKTAEQLGLHI